MKEADQIIHGVGILLHQDSSSTYGTDIHPQRKGSCGVLFGKHGTQQLFDILKRLLTIRGPDRVSNRKTIISRHTEELIELAMSLWN